MLKASGERDVRGVQRQRFCARSDSAQKRCAQSVATPWLRGSSSDQQPLHLNVFIAEDALQELCRARAGPCGGAALWQRRRGVLGRRAVSGVRVSHLFASLSDRFCGERRY